MQGSLSIVLRALPSFLFQYCLCVGFLVVAKCFTPPCLEVGDGVRWSRILAENLAAWLRPGLQALITEDELHPPLNGIALNTVREGWISKGKSGADKREKVRMMLGR